MTARNQRMSLLGHSEDAKTCEDRKTIGGFGEGGGGGRMRLLSNASQYDPDTISDFTSASSFSSASSSSDFVLPKLKRTASGTNLAGGGGQMTRRDSFRKNRYSFGDGTNPNTNLSEPSYSLPIKYGSFSNSNSNLSTTSTLTASSIGSDSNSNNSFYGKPLSRSSSQRMEPSRLQAILLARQPNIKKIQGRTMASIIEKPYNRGGDGPATKYMTMITNFIIIGGREDAGNRADLLEHGVTHILNCAQQVPNFYEEDFIYGNISILDDEKVEIKPFVEQILRFLGEVEDCRGRCLVHCVSGVSRSVTAVIIYFMHRHRLCLRHSFDYIKSCRPFICPNEGFKVKLAVMENELLGYSTVSKKAGKVWEFYSFNEIKNSLTFKDPSTIIGDKAKSSACLIS